MTPASTRRAAGKGTAAPNALGDEWPPFLILAALTLFFLSQMPAVPALTQMGCILCGTGLLAATIAFCRGFAENIGRAVTKAPTLILLLLTAWTAYRFCTTPAEYRLLATTDLLRIVAGTLVYFAAAYTLTTARQAGLLIVGVALFATFVSFVDFSYFGATAAKTDYFVQQTSILGSHMTAGGFLAMLLPVVTAFAFGPGLEDKPRLVAQLTFMLIAFALILSRARAGWVSGVVALLVVSGLFALLRLRHRWRQGIEKTPPRRRAEPFLVRLIGSPLPFIVIGLIVLVAGGGISTVLSNRSVSLRHVLTGNITTDDTTFLARLTVWRGAVLMIHDKPLLGRGLGAFVVEEGVWTHYGDEPIHVLLKGTGHQNRAHNYYLQWAADAGLIGLFLYLAFLAAWTIAMVRGLPLAGSPERRAIVIGAVGAMAAAAVDGIASPMYQMHGNYALLLMWMGLGLGALRTDPPRSGVRLDFSQQELNPAADDLPAIRDATPVWDWLAAAAFAGAAVSILFLIGRQIIAEGRRTPPGTLRVSVIPNTWQVRPGTPIIFRAVYTDPHGIEQTTIPGTKWKVYASDQIIEAPGAGILRLDAPRFPTGLDDHRIPHAGLRLVPPPGTPSTAITVRASYRDEWGRSITSAASIAVRPDAPLIPQNALPEWRNGADVAPGVLPYTPDSQ